mgnify:CR=1 FL=1
MRAYEDKKGFVPKTRRQHYVGRVPCMDHPNTFGHGLVSMWLLGVWRCHHRGLTRGLKEQNWIWSWECCQKDMTRLEHLHECFLRVQTESLKAILLQLLFPAAIFYCFVWNNLESFYSDQIHVHCTWNSISDIISVIYFTISNI